VTFDVAIWISVTISVTKISGNKRDERFLMIILESSSFLFEGPWTVGKRGREGTQIMSQLGHTSSDVSLLYINTSREKSRQAAEALDKSRENKYGTHK
jgi:hypothetical protein